MATIMTGEQRRRLERMDRDDLTALQLGKLNSLLADILPTNELYGRKFASCPHQLSSLADLECLPTTVKEELLPTSSGRWPANLSHPLERYVRFHQTSGTRGRPMTVLDTAEDWAWWIETWQFVLDAAEVTLDDRVMMAFSFGPFIGFWSAFDAVRARGALTIPAGGLGSAARVDLIARTGATVLFCTPTYALHLAEVAGQEHFSLGALPIEKIIVAGEPGGSLPAVKERIETTWQARVFDHAGASEVGPWGYPDAAGRGLHVVESEFLVEFHAVDSGQPAKAGELSHLVLTTLGRRGCPVIRYRTGDLVRPQWPETDGNRFVFLEGGLLGRADDMLIIRGVNVFPSSIAEILHGFPEVVEYRLTAHRQGEMDELLVEVEDYLQQPERIAHELELRLGLKIDVRCVPGLALPRFEGKGERFIDER